MALVTCSECGSKVSEKARSCPSCGNPGPFGSDTVESKETASGDLRPKAVPEATAEATAPPVAERAVQPDYVGLFFRGAVAGAVFAAVLFFGFVLLSQSAFPDSSLPMINFVGILLCGLCGGIAAAMAGHFRGDVAFISAVTWALALGVVNGSFGAAIFGGVMGLLFGYFYQWLIAPKA